MQFRNGIPAGQLTAARWRKSSASNPNGCCVEVAQLPGGEVAVRNSRDPYGPALIYTPAEVTAFLTGVKNGEFDDLHPGGSASLPHAPAVICRRYGRRAAWSGELPSGGDGEPRGPAVLRMMLANQLRRYRESAGTSPEQAAYEIRASRSKISRMEHGRVGFKRWDVADLLNLYGVRDEQVRAIGRAVMRAQLAHLIAVAGLPRITMQVVPFSRGGHAAAGGSFAVLRFAAPEVPDIVYIEQLTSALYLDSRDDVDHYLEVMNDLSTEALTPAASAALLVEITKQAPRARAWRRAQPQTLRQQP